MVLVPMLRIAFTNLVLAWQLEKQWPLPAGTDPFLAGLPHGGQVGTAAMEAISLDRGQREKGHMWAVVAATLVPVG